MMLFVLDKNPIKSVEYLKENSNKRFVFKQLLELGQLICSSGISNEYKKIPQGRQIQSWILQNPKYTLEMFVKLFVESYGTISMKQKTIERIHNIVNDLENYIKRSSINEKNKTAIFRYKNGYETLFDNNSELPIDKAIEEYKKYLKWKFM